MSRDKMLALLERYFPGAVIYDRFETERNSLRFHWGTRKFRMSMGLMIEECGDGFRRSTDKCDKLTTLMKDALWDMEASEM